MLVFFRADDIGWEQDRFERLAGLFLDRGLRLNAAAIPTACRQAGRRPRWERFAGCLEVHSHGYAHLDHETAGKKSEFGEGRAEEDVRRDLLESRRVVAELFEGLYFPAFVPPWNRIADRFLPLLPQAGFRLLSRDGASRAGVAGLAERNIEVDLHTSRTPGPATPEALLASLRGRADAGPIGVMLHHARMEDGDFAFLARLLDLLAAEGARTAVFSELLS